MSTDTGQKFIDAFASFFAPDRDATAVALAQNMAAVKYRIHQDKDANLTNVNGNGLVTDKQDYNIAHTYTVDPSTLVRFKVSSFKMTAAVNIAAANTNYATVQLVYNNGNGGSDTVIAAANTENKSGSLGAVTSAIPASFTVTAANAVVPSGSCVQIKVTKSGAGGLALPELDFHVVGAVV
jgi:hypothetical protein